MTPGSIEGRQERAKKGSPWWQRKGDQEQKGKWRAKKAVTRSKEGGNLGPHQRWRARAAEEQATKSKKGVAGSKKAVTKGGSDFNWS